MNDYIVAISFIPIPESLRPKLNSFLKDASLTELKLDTYFTDDKKALLEQIVMQYGTKHLNYNAYKFINKDVNAIVDFLFNMYVNTDKLKSGFFKKMDAAKVEEAKTYLKMAVTQKMVDLLSSVVEDIKVEPELPKPEVAAPPQQGGNQAAYQEQRNYNKMINAQGLVTEINNLNNNRVMADTNFPMPFSANGKQYEMSHVEGASNNTIQSIFPSHGGAKKKQQRKYKGGQMSQSDVQANREMNKIVNTNELISELNALREGRTYGDTSFPDPFSASGKNYEMSNVEAASSNTMQNILPQFGGKRKTKKLSK